MQGSGPCTQSRALACIYVFEFKLQGTAEQALAQIRDKRYFEKYLDDGREIVLVGAAFDPETRNIERWLPEGVG